MREHVRLLTVRIWGRRLALFLCGIAAMSPSSPLREPDTILDIDREFVAGSRIVIHSLSPAEVERLVVLGKVWGFLKYHHPRVTSGQLHWDFELFRVLPPVLAATDAAERNAVMLRWIERLGEVQNCEECASPPSDVHLQPRIDWIRDEALLGAELSEALQQVWKNRPTGHQFWVTTHFGVGNPDFSREPRYDDLDHVDAGYRILAAFRLWNIIEYWFPYRDQIDESWDGVLRELLPVFVEADDHDEYERALLRLIARVHDTHANIWTALDERPPRGSCGLPVEFHFIEGHAIVSRASKEISLQVGDILLALDGRALADLIEEWRPYHPASNEAWRLRDIATVLSRGECGPVNAVIDRYGRELELELERVNWGGNGSYRVDGRSGDAFQRLGDDVAYINLSEIELDEIPHYIEAAADTRGLVIDIRNYPREVVVFALGQHLVDTPTPFVRATKPDLSNPGAFKWKDSLELIPKPPHYAGKVVILVNEITLSRAEYTAMAFRAAPGSLVIGSTTAGADGTVSRIALPGGEWTGISGTGIFYPDKRPTQRIGIVPDIWVTPTREGIRARRDELVERALREILGPDVPEAMIRELARPPAG